MHKLFGGFTGGITGLGLLVLRVVFGLGMCLHGLPKLTNPQGPMAWMGPDSTVPAVFQGLAVLAEVGGGLGLIFGFLTPLSALGVICVMGGAYVLVHGPKGDPFIAKGGKPSYELLVLYLTVGVTLLLTGPGRFSLDNLIFNRNRK